MAEQYPVPQFIESEGKIIYFLTFRQFFLLVGGVGASIAYFYLLPFWAFVPLAVITLGSVSLIAFVKINNQSIIKVLLNYIGFSFGAKNYVWKKKETAYPFIQTQKTAPAKDELGAAPLKVHESKLKDIKRSIETKR